MELSGMKSFNSIVIIQRKTMIEPEEMKIKQIRRESSPTRPNKSFEITLTEKSNWNNHGITVRWPFQANSLQHKLINLEDFNIKVRTQTIFEGWLFVLKFFSKSEHLIIILQFVNGKWSEIRWEISSFVYHHYVVDK